MAGKELLYDYDYPTPKKKVQPDGDGPDMESIARMLEAADYDARAGQQGRMGDLARNFETRDFAEDLSDRTNAVQDAMGNELSDMVFGDDGPYATQIEGEEARQMQNEAQQMLYEEFLNPTDEGDVVAINVGGAKGSLEMDEPVPDEMRDWGPRGMSTYGGPEETNPDAQLAGTKEGAAIEQLGEMPAEAMEPLDNMKTGEPEELGDQAERVIIRHRPDAEKADSPQFSPAQYSVDAEYPEQPPPMPEPMPEPEPSRRDRRKARKAKKASAGYGGSGFVRSQDKRY